MREQLESFLSHLGLEKGHSENTLVAYRNDLTQFIEALENSEPPPSDWSQVTKDAIVGYLTRLQDRGYAASTIARKVAAIKSFFHFLVSEGLVAEDQTSSLDSPKVKKRLPRTLTGDDVERLLAAPLRENGPKAQRDIALLELLYATGMRVTELVSLKVEDVDLVAGAVRVQHGRGNKERLVPVRERAVTALRDYIEHGRASLVRPGEDTSALFLNHRGQQLTRQGTWLIIKEYAHAAGIDATVTPHVLRHSFAVHMLASEQATLAQIQNYLGHANISTTQIYTHITGDHKRRAHEEVRPKVKELTPQPT